MREHPWSLRRPTHQHYQWFQNLIDLHALTKSWLSQLDAHGKEQGKLLRIIPPEVRRKLEILESLIQASRPADLEILLDSAYPEELLTKLELSIWTVQAWSIQHVQEVTQETEKDALKNLFEQTAWSAGRSCAQQRWVNFPVDARNDLQALFHAVENSPLAGYPHENFAIVRRSTPTSLELEWMEYPHHKKTTELELTSSKIFHFHTHWIRGFLYHLNTKIVVDLKDFGDGHFSQTWRFHQVQH